MSDIVMFSGLVRLLDKDDKPIQDIGWENFPATGETNARNWLAHKALDTLRELGVEGGKAIIKGVWREGGTPAKQSAWDLVRAGSTGLATAPAEPKSEPFACPITAMCGTVIVGKLNRATGTFDISPTED